MLFNFEQIMSSFVLDVNNCKKQKKKKKKSHPPHLIIRLSAFSLNCSGSEQIRCYLGIEDLSTQL